MVFISLTILFLNFESLNEERRDGRSNSPAEKRCLIINKL